MGRESSHLTKELFNLPPLILKARHLSGSALSFCWIDIGLPEQAAGGVPLGWGLVVGDRPTELSCFIFLWIDPKLKNFVLAIISYIMCYSMQKQ